MSDDIVRLVSKAGRPVGHTELAKALKVPPSSLKLRIALSTLVGNHKLTSQKMRPPKGDPLKYESYYQVVGSTKQLAKSI